MGQAAAKGSYCGNRFHAAALRIVWHNGGPRWGAILAIWAIPHKNLSAVVLPYMAALLATASTVYEDYILQAIVVDHSPLFLNVGN
jgi:hypothetical protein